MKNLAPDSDSHISADRINHRIDTAAFILAIINEKKRSEGEPHTANPVLIQKISKQTSQLTHPVYAILASLYEKLGPGELIKQIIECSYGITTTPEIEQCIDLLDNAGGPGSAAIPDNVHALISAAKQEMMQRTAELCAPLDPVPQMKNLTGVKINIDIMTTPSLFLSPDYKGRQGVVINDKHSGKTIVHMFFGYPLDEDPEKYQLNRHFVEQGGRHYIVSQYIRDNWAALSARLDKNAQLKNEVTALIESHPGRKIWPGVVKIHLQTAFKMLMGMPEQSFCLVAYKVAALKGMPLLPWFYDWLRENKAHNGANMPLLSLADDMSLQMQTWKNQANMVKGIARLRNES